MVGITDMMEKDSAISAALDATVDAALARALLAPALPTDFRERLRAALARAGDTETLEMQRARLEREHRDELAALRDGYLRLRRRTLAALIGGTFALGAGVVLFLPWLSAAFGGYTVAAVSVFGGFVGFLMGVSASRVRGMSLTPTTSD